MNPSLITFALFLLWLAPARSEETDPDEVIGTVKAATVFLQVQGAKWAGAGTGFVVSVDKEDVLVATNFHVISGPAFDRAAKPSEIARLMKAVAVTAVFGSGTRNERSLKAEPVAADPEHDLAVVRVSGLKNPPDPIDYATPPRLVETMQVFTFGYPFGKALSTTKGSPAITVGKASISSLRKDENGELAIIQIDGALNPGNSGGPIIDAKGKLVGVAVAKIRESDGIGLAIPALELRRMMRGRVGPIHTIAGRSPGGNLIVRAEVALMDPARSIRAVTLHYIMQGEKERRPSLLEPLEKQHGARKIPLKIEGGVAAAELTVEATNRELFLQATPEGPSGSLPSTAIRSVRTSPTSGITKLDVEPKSEPQSPKTAEKPPAKEEPGDKSGLRTSEIRGGGDNPEFREVAKEGYILVGMEIGVGKFVNKDIVVAVRGVYRKGEWEYKGKQWGNLAYKTVKVVAKPGYAIGAVRVKTGLAVDCMSITFMKVTKTGLDTNDTYDTEWIGGTRTTAPFKMGDDGDPCVGIVGKTHSKGEVWGFGLVQQPVKAK